MTFSDMSSPVYYVIRVICILKKLKDNQKLQGNQKLKDNV